MKPIVTGILSGMALFFLGAGVWAHDGDHPPDMRIWRDADGFFEMEASFVLVKGNQVQLRKHDGSLLWLPIERLAKTDQSWLRNRLEAIRILNAVGAQENDAANPSLVQGARAGDDSIDPALVVFLAFGVVLFVGLVRVGAKRGWLVSGAAAGLGLASVGWILAAQGENRAAKIQKHFEPFKGKVSFSSDDRFAYIESRGIPDHPMMIGIRAWQQQVPIPQAYTGTNAWRIPLNPKIAANPVSAKSALFRGAIALAVNGVPIFNPIKNDGRTDTYLAGELDEYGGHCGRGDDYHYHIGPVHLEKVVGRGNPIGYALDGFPLYGYTDESGKEVSGLDRFNGKFVNGEYRYHSTKKYPYINGGLKGEVTVKEDQIDPQPRANPVRPDLPPLRGAVITGFTLDDETKTNTVLYQLQGKTQSVRYTHLPSGTYRFVFTDGKGNETVEEYSPRDRGQGKKDRPDGGKDNKKGKKEAGKKGPEDRKGGQGKGQKKDDQGKGAEGPRLPWLAAHFEELDTNMDGMLTESELRVEITKTFDGYDGNKNGVLESSEYSGRGNGVRSALAGFVRGHSSELIDDEGRITRKSLTDTMMRMFQKSDKKGLGKITRAEASQTQDKGRP